VVLGLSTAVPAENVHDGHFPLSWFSRLLEVRLASAQSPVGRTPGNPHGTQPRHGGYVPTAATMVNGGAGRAPGRVKGALDAYRPYQPAAKPTKIKGKPRGFVAETSKRDAAKSTATMDDYRNADGSTTRVYTPGASNYRTSGGSWQKIDPTLVKDGAGWKVKASGLKVSLAGRAAPSATPTVATAAVAPLADVTLPSGDAAGYDLAGASAVEAVVTGSTATYPGVLPGADLRLGADAGGLRQALVLAVPPAVNEWVFPLRLGGLTPRLGKGGSVELVDTSGKVRAWFPAGSMSDSSSIR